MVINPFLLVALGVPDSLPIRHKLPERHDDIVGQGQHSNSQLLLSGGRPLLVLIKQKVLTLPRRLIAHYWKPPQ